MLVCATHIWKTTTRQVLHHSFHHANGSEEAGHYVSVMSYTADTIAVLIFCQRNS